MLGEVVMYEDIVTVFVSATKNVLFKNIAILEAPKEAEFSASSFSLNRAKTGALPETIFSFAESGASFLCSEQ